MTTSAPLASIGRLNAHARAAGPRSAIYAYKTLASMLAVASDQAPIRFVQWTGACNRCEKGRFRYWGESRTVRCRYCSGTGRKTLRFTEVTHADGQVWHHPWEGYVSPQPGREIARAAGFGINDRGDVLAKGGSLYAWGPAAEWKPLAPGKRLPLAELVDLLNEVEDWVEGIDTGPLNSYCWYALEKARRCLKARSSSGYFFDHSDSEAYSLDLGRAPIGCFVCGDETDLAGHGFGRCSTLFHWSLPVCNAHKQSPFPDGPTPEVLMTPAVRHWMARRERA